jgi:predicted transposase YbfD/YdcC
VSDKTVIRELWICDGLTPDYIREELNFPAVYQVGYLRKSPYQGGVLKKQDHHYGATSCSKVELGPDDFLDKTRKHWEVENGLHHVKDRSWFEDHQYSSSRRKGGTLSILRNLSLNAMRVLLPPESDRKKRKYQKSLPLQAIGYITKPLRALARLAGI